MTWDKSVLAKIETEISKGLLLGQRPDEIATAVMASISENDVSKARAKCVKCNGVGYTWKRPALDEGHFIQWRCGCQ
jgi:hypothetical protein